MYNSSFHQVFHVTWTYWPCIDNESQEVENQVVAQWAHDYQKCLDLAQKCLLKIQESMCSQMKHTPTPKYVAGQQVWLLMCLWQPQLLEVWWVGPFEVQEVLHNACQLHLSSMLKIHPVVNVAYLKLASAVATGDPK